MGRTFSQPEDSFPGELACFLIVTAVFGEKKLSETMEECRGAMGKPFFHCENVPAHC
jgi:hypothetical protein